MNQSPIDNLLEEKEPKLLSSLDAFSETNWARVPKKLQEQALKPLREFIENLTDDYSLRLVEKWRNQYSNGYRIGSDDIIFHLGLGMHIRNILRQGLLDEYLPEVEYPEGSAKNWDDYYMAALREALGLERKQ